MKWIRSKLVGNSSQSESGAKARAVQTLRECRGASVLRASVWSACALAPLLICLVMIALTLATARAATNDLTGLLQKGLFEEEANRNLNSAISNYQTLATAFDKDRQVAATAIFRLGECYRKLGRTNEAAAQYQRIVNDFSDQQTLVTLSRQNLAGMGMAAQETSSKPVARRSTSEEAETLAAELAAIEKLKSDPAQQARATLALYPDQALQRMLLQLPKLQEQEAKLTAKPDTKYQDLNGYYVAVGPQAVEPVERHGTNLLSDARWELQQQLSFISERVDFILGVQKARLQVLQSAADEGAVSQVAGNEAAPITDDEEKEIRRIQQLIQNSPDLINAPSAGPNGNWTPLIQAAHQGWVRVATFLLDHGANVDARSPVETPLIAATRSGNKALVELLLSRGANIEARDNNGETALHAATQKGFLTVVKTLIVHGADVNARNSAQNGLETPLHLAAHYDRPEVIKLLLAHRADLNARTSRGQSPIFNAIAYDNVPALNALLAGKPEVNIVDDHGATPLALAASRGNVETAGILTTNGANPNFGTTNLPLATAIEYVASPTDRSNLCALLVQHGADPNKVAPIRTSSQWNQYLQKANGNNFDIYNGDRIVSVSPLQLAVARDETDVVKLLLDHNADAKGPGIKRATLLLDAADHSNVEIAEALLAHGADVNARGVFGETALHLAADHGNTNLVHLLLTEKADVNLQDQSGRTPLDYAKGWSSDSNLRQKYSEIAEDLRQHGALDELPNFNAIRVTRQGAARTMVFQRSSNDWNHFTLFETLINFYQNNPVPGGGFPGGIMIPGPSNDRSRQLNNQVTSFPFPDLTRLAILHPIRGTTNSTRTVVNLLNATNGIDCSKDIPLQFGDTVEIPEREHSLAEHPLGLNVIDRDQMVDCRKGAAKLNVRNRTVDLQLYPFESSRVGTVLSRNEAQAVLMASSDLAHVKVTRRDAATGKKQEWTLDCSDLNKAPDLWIRDGDVIEVPEK